MRPFAELALVLVASAAVASSPSRARLHDAPRAIATNDNQSPSGTLAHGVLTLALVAREGVWHPDADDAPGMLIQAFGEVGKRLSIPGPLIRVPAGTEIRIKVTNAIPGATLRVHGLGGRAANAGATDDTLTVPDGATRERRFRLDTPGTYLYWATSGDAKFNRRTHLDGQLNGAIVVDDPAAGAPRDRVFVISEFGDSVMASGAPLEGTLFVPVINGRSWPHTERFTFDQGDTVHWRLVNGSYAPHPMHLHGFYYSVDSRGDGLTDTLYAASSRQRVVTNRLAPGGTMTLSWVAARPGNWLFHCHIPVHIERHLPLDRSSSRAVSQAGERSGHAHEAMGGLVLGITVRPRGPQPAVASAPARRLRLVASVDGDGTPEEPAFGFALAEGSARPAPRTSHGAGPVLVLTRDEPVAITVVNKLPEATAVHWHGIELVSYSDGVPGFSGSRGHLAPIIEPQDSFVAEFTPPRAGTFIYHTHVNEKRQEPAGLSGVIVVLEPGARFDPATDHPILLTTPRRVADRERIQLNGALDPTPLEWRAGERHRLRLVDIIIGGPGGVVVQFMRDSTVVNWRPLAKDGLDLPPEFAVTKRAIERITIGETYDYEVTLDTPGDYRLEMRLFAVPKPLRAVQVIHVR